jgi:hypothetical protein
MAFVADDPPLEGHGNFSAAPHHARSSLPPEISPQTLAITAVVALD